MHEDQVLRWLEAFFFASRNAQNACKGTKKKQNIMDGKLKWVKGNQSIFDDDHHPVKMVKMKLCHGGWRWWQSPKKLGGHGT